jgi:hypothetical protein
MFCSSIESLYVNRPTNRLRGRLNVRLTQVVYRGRRRLLGNLNGYHD